MDESTIKTYNLFAEEYDDETSVFWDKFPQTFLDKFINSSGKNILDVGSGPGRDGLLLKQAGKEVVCLDASEAMIEISRAKGLKSIQGSFDKLPFPDESFAGIWSYTSLLHTPKSKINQALNEIFRVLKPKGVFALGLIEGDTEGYRDYTTANNHRWFSYYQEAEVRQLLEDHNASLFYFEKFKPGKRNYLNFIFIKN